MRIFLKVYNKLLDLSRHHHAPFYLSLLGVAESAFFRVPPDVLLIPMAFANRSKAWFYAGLTTLASLVGSCVGYSLGWFFFVLIHPYIIHFGYETVYQDIVVWFERWGSFAMFAASFSPIPFRSFTIIAGASHMAFLPFILATLLGRGCRYFLISGSIVLGGERAERFLQRYIDWLGWIVVVAVVIAFSVASIAELRA